jgi:hypothetical protein
VTALECFHKLTNTKACHGKRAFRVCECGRRVTTLYVHFPRPESRLTWTDMSFVNVDNANGDGVGGGIAAYVQ